MNSKFLSSWNATVNFSNSRHVSVYISFIRIKGLLLSANRRLLRAEEEVEFSASLEVAAPGIVFSLEYGDGTTSTENATSMFLHRYVTTGRHVATVQARDNGSDTEVCMTLVNSYEGIILKGDEAFRLSDQIFYLAYCTSLKTLLERL